MLFRDVIKECYLCGEGIIIEEVMAQMDVASALADSLFCIYLQRQYSASRELNTFLETYHMDASQIEDPSELEYLHALEVIYIIPYYASSWSHSVSRNLQTVSRREEGRTRTS